MERPFRHEAENRHLSFEVETDPHLARSVVTDSKRLQQVLKNLLSNAFKFTEVGGVRLSVSLARGGWTAGHPILSKAASVVAFEVTDTGIGIPPEDMIRIFNHGFTTKRDGHGFGLHSGALTAKEIGGTLTVYSEGTGRGSKFTLELPLSTEKLPHPT